MSTKKPTTKAAKRATREAQRKPRPASAKPEDRFEEISRLVGELPPGEIADAIGVLAITEDSGLRARVSAALLALQSGKAPTDPMLAADLKAHCQKLRKGRGVFTHHIAMRTEWVKTIADLEADLGRLRAVLPQPPTTTTKKTTPRRKRG
jgi:hypothetical protein